MALNHSPFYSKSSYRAPPKAAIDSRSLISSFTPGWILMYNTLPAHVSDFDSPMVDSYGWNGSRWSLSSAEVFVPFCLTDRQTRRIQNFLFLQGKLLFFSRKFWFLNRFGSNFVLDGFCSQCSASFGSIGLVLLCYLVVLNEILVPELGFQSWLPWLSCFGIVSGTAGLKMAN